MPYETDLPHSLFIPPDGAGGEFYNQGIGIVMLDKRCYLFNPIPMLLGRDDFARYSR